MVSAQQAVLSSRNCPEDFQMVVPFISDDDDADDNIKPISGTCSSRECIIPIDIRQGLNRQIKNYKHGIGIDEASSAILLLLLHDL
jgi:hypothetical protein